MADNVCLACAAGDDSAHLDTAEGRAHLWCVGFANGIDVATRRDVITLCAAHVGAMKKIFDSFSKLPGGLVVVPMCVKLARPGGGN